MKVQRHADTTPIKGPATAFTGDVWLDWRLESPEPGRASTAVLRFAPGARTAWHTHPLGQTLIVTEGTGWTQCRGGPKVEIGVGDVIWCPPGHEHWHGATATTALTHIAVTEALDGRSVDWLEHVSEEEYLAGDPQRD